MRTPVRAFRVNSRCLSAIAVALGAAAMAGCADTGGPINGDVRALSPEEVRLQNAEAKLTELSRRIDGLSANRAGNQQVNDDLRSLRGDVEQLRHDFDEAQRQEASRAQSVEQRLQRLEGTAPATAATGSAAAVGAPDSAGTATAAPAANASAATTAPAAASSAGSPAPQEEALYSASLNQLKGGRYDDAIRGFRTMLDQYPQGNYADNAWYWMGEAYYVKRDSTSSAQSFQSLIDRFPASPKVPDAMLKIGLINLDQKKTEQGRAMLQRVIKEFPNSKAADVARSKLKPG